MIAPSLRRSGARDADVIRDITRACYGKWVAVLGREPLPMQVNYAEALLVHRIDLMTLGGLPIGLIETVPAIDHTMIENVAVLPAYQGRGYGRLLLNHGEEVAEIDRSKHLRLYTNKLFAEKIRLYQRNGFGVDREEPFRGGVVVHMSKQIRSTDLG